MRAIAALCFFVAISVCRANDAGPTVADLTGELRHPLDPAGKTASVLIFYWHDCPICNTYAPEINRISERYTNFNFFIVQVDPDLTVIAAQRHAKDYDLRAPVLLDAHHALVKLAKATTAPEAIVFGGHRKVLYRGRIDNLLLGKDMKVTATLPDGTMVPLVQVENGDFNWQTGYELKTPLKLPAGSRVDLEAHYDNSANNPVNPNNPPKVVTWGEQTTDEMCLAFLSFTLDREHLKDGIAVRGYDLQEHRKNPPPAAP